MMLLHQRKICNHKNIKKCVSFDERKIVISLPAVPTTLDPTKSTPSETALQMLFKGQTNARIKREALLDHNVQKACSLVIGQLTNLLQSKLKQRTQWATILSAQDATALISLIADQSHQDNHLPLRRSKTSFVGSASSQSQCS
jgi:hypothetical protein